MSRLLNHSWVIILFISMVSTSRSWGQNQCKILIICDEAAEVAIDGQKRDGLQANKPLAYEVAPGEHFIQLKTASALNNFEEVVSVDAGSQKVLNLKFKETQNNPPAAKPSTGELIPIEQTTLTITGSIEVGAWLSSNPGKDYPNYPSQYYAFEAGDEIVLNLTLQNKNGSNVLEVATYPDGIVKYSNQNFQSLEDIRIKVDKRSIYRFTLATNTALDRTMKFEIGRIPGSPETKNFNPAVRWVEKLDTTWSIEHERSYTYETVSLQAPQNFYINGGRNAMFLGGTSRISIPLNLPANTVNWYYEFSAYRDKAEIDQVTSSLSLAGDVASALDQTGIASFALGMLNQPPGGDVCDIFLLDGNNVSAFENKTDYSYYREGSRENIKSGVVRIDGERFQSGSWYIGIKNPSSGYGVHVAIEVVAVTAKGSVKPVRKPEKVTRVKVPSMQN